MTLLTSCWFIIESIIIPDGYVKWFYLSFYIHPLLLFLCQIFLWVKLIVSLPLRITCFIASSIFRFFSSLFCSSPIITQTNISEFVDEVEENEIPIVAASHYQITAHEEKTGCEIGSSLLVLEEAISLEDESSEEYYLSCDCSSNSSSPSQTQLDHHHADMAICSSSSSSVVTEDVDEMNGYLPSVCGSNSPLMERELIEYQRGWEEDLDSFYQEYTKRMRWFDLLNHDRTSGISAMIDKHLASPCSFESIKPADFSIAYISWSKIDRRRLLRSLGSDFELVYVAQSCLSWEALYHQYCKVEAFACSNSSQNSAFYGQDVAGRFQKFRVLLERFMEDERCEGKRYWNYAQRRFSSKCLLQVPQVSSGYMEGEGMRATEVLKEIEKCIEAFWLYVKTDDEKKPMWRRVKSFLLTNYYPPVEDPRDLELLAGLTNTLRKELWLRELQGKERCWLKRVINPLEESQKKEILFATIDMKLVSRVLKMSMISTSQLKWCQEKLTNIEFEEGKIRRRACSSSLLIS